ncbi:hypothetical protein AOLI_G00304380 [Acnodon oligacanthus]
MTSYSICEQEDTELHKLQERYQRKNRDIYEGHIHENTRSGCMIKQAFRTRASAYLMPVWMLPTLKMLSHSFLPRTILHPQLKAVRRKQHLSRNACCQTKRMSLSQQRHLADAPRLELPKAIFR